MPFQVQIGPPQISIHHGQTIPITEQDGQINWPSERGLTKTMLAFGGLKRFWK